MAIFDVTLYGAVGDGITDDRAAIQAAVDAAAAAGGGTVLVPAGVYAISNGGLEPSDAGIQLPSNVSLVGEGMGVSTIKVIDGATLLPGETNYMTGIVRTPYGVETTNVTVSGLTLDGNRDNTVGKVDGFFCGTAPGAGTAASDISLTGVEIKDCYGYGFDPHEETVRLTIEDCVSHGNYLDGFTLDFQVDATIRNNVAYDNDRHGFNIVTSSHDVLLEGNESYGNGSAGMVVQRGSENRPVPYNIEILNNNIHDNVKEGILLKMTEDVTIQGNTIEGNGKQGVFVSGSSGVIINDNDFSNNSQSSNGFYGEVQLNPYTDPLFGATYPIDGNTVTNNTMIADGVVRAGWGIYQSTSFTDSLFSGNTISGMTKAPTVTPPQLRVDLPDLEAAADAPFSYALPALSFVEIDPNDSLTYSARLANGSALPSWLNFNATTRTFSGTPPEGAVGTFEVEVIAADKSGKSENDIFDLVVSLEGGNPAPTLTNPIPDQPNLVEDAAFSYTFPANSFSDPGDTLTYAAVQADGTALPAWLSFDPVTRTFSGSPDNASVGDLEVQVVATDSSGGNVVDFFTLTIANTDDAPTVTNPIDDQTVVTGVSYNYIFPADSITDVDAGDVLTFTATLANGDPLPDWLSFDPAARRFYGTADGTDLGQVDIRVTATDLLGASVSDVFEIDVTATAPAQTIFDVTQPPFNAAGDGVTDDRAAIQAAADAAFAAGGGVVYIPAGTYAIGTGGEEGTYAGIQLRSNVSLMGDGMGQSTIKVIDGAVPLTGETSLMTGIVRTPFNEVTTNVTISDITLDGNRANTTGKVDGFFTGVAPGSAASSSDITVSRVEIENCSGYGFDPHEITVRLTIEDSVAHHNGLDGFTLDYLIDAVITGNESYANDRHGFNVVTSSTNVTLEGNNSHDNGSTGITVQRGSEDIPSPNEIIIRDNIVTDNAAEGIFIKLSHDVTIEGNTVSGSGKHGIYLQGSSDVVVRANELLNNSQLSDGTYSEINLATLPDAVTGTVFGIDRNSILDNIITDDGAIRAGYGIRQTTSSVGSHFTGNVITGPTKGLTVTPPQLDVPLADASAPSSVPFTYTVPAGSFIDVDVNEVITYTARLANGSPLPSWLVFNATTQTFSGTPGAGDAGVLDIQVIASDKQAKFESDIFRLSVSNNTAPTLATPLTDPAAIDQGDPFAYIVPSGTFVEVDAGDSLTYSATLANGSPLPAWLTVDPLNGNLSGTPGTGTGGTYTVRVIATDLAGASAFDDIEVSVLGNAAPTLVNPIADRPGLAEAQPFTYTVPADTFADAGDTLTYSATLASGAALPAWLTFDALTRTFTGTPPQSGVGVIDVRVIATDTGLNAIFDDFTLTVAEVAMPPALVTPIADQTGIELAAFSFTIPAGSFVDQDPGDAITYTAKLADGTPLPAWLTFNAATQTFSGTPGSPDVGALSIIVTATDLANTFVSDTFTLTIGGAGGVQNGDGLANTINGTALGDTLNGLAGDDILNGLAGNDVINGGTENDTLDGGTGADQMNGGAGNDTYYVDDLGDVVIETNAAGGVDQVYATASFVAGTNVDNVTLLGTDDIKVTGNGQANILVGNSGRNAIDGGGAADTMSGGDGDDIYYVSTGSDVVIELANEGIDTVIAASGYTLTANVERLTLAGVTFAGTGNTLDNLMKGNDAANKLLGLDGNDTINGYAGNDTLEGGAGIDRLNGGTGVDLMKGGLGNDIYYVDDASDTTLELSGQGTDRTYAYINHTLASHVEELYLLGDALTGTGNTLDNVIVGSIKNNTLAGLDGNDTISGGAGNDGITGGIGIDTLSGGDGIDTIDGGDNADTVNGNAGRDTLTGGNGDDTITGGAAKDVMTGGSGADGFLFDDGDFESPTIGNADRVTDFVHIQGDKLDLSRVDAKIGGGDDAFSFIGTAAFSGVQGQLRYQHLSDGNTYVYADQNGDRVQDFVIRLDGSVPLVSTDFIL